MFTAALEEKSPTKEKPKQGEESKLPCLIAKIQTELLFKFPEFRKDSIDAVFLWSDDAGSRFRVNIWVKDRIQKSFFIVIDGDTITLR